MILFLILFGIYVLAITSFFIIANFLHVKKKKYKTDDITGMIRGPLNLMDFDSDIEDIQKFLKQQSKF